jgi:hypothetical protein
MAWNRRGAAVLSGAALVLGIGWVVAGRALDTGERGVAVEAAELRGGAEVVDATADPRGTGIVPMDDPVHPQDLRIFQERMELARSEGLRSLPIGEVIARLGVTFVDTRYTPGTLEGPGPERLVINLRELDCVTFVENALALSRLVRAGSDEFDDYRGELLRIRYRGGVLDGYVSRLHYFSEWIADAERKGLVRDITGELGGIPMNEPLDFMSRNPDAYPRLSDPAELEAIARMEAALRDAPRSFIPQERIAEVAPRIRNGDIIAATSAIRGLDVAHTGIALWVDGELHLLHAPLVGSSVEISAVPLAQRILGLSGQDGIMVARPL